MLSRIQRAKNFMSRKRSIARRREALVGRHRQPQIESLEGRALMATFAVDNANDSGTGSLRQAILDANSSSGADLITFNIPGSGVHTISPQSALPLITDPVVIDGYTQPGSSENLLSTGNNAVLQIELNGAQAGSAHGLHITAGNSTVKGLVINRFASDGIRLDTLGGNIIAGNFIGTDTTGQIALGNGTSGIGQPAAAFLEFASAFGIEIIGGSSDNIIGTNGDNVGDAGERNVISSNAKADVFISGVGTDRNVVAGNFIGTNANGTEVFGQVAQGGFNYNVGVFINGGSQSNRIGTDGNGTADVAERNIISGHFGNTGRADDHHSSRGVEIANLSSPLTTIGQNIIAGNFVGTDVSGTRKLGNSVGIGMQLSDRNRIGTNSDGIADEIERNLVSGNGVGVHLFGSNENAIAGNYIGTDVTGTTNTDVVAGDLGNSTGIWVLSSASNMIGGTSVGAGNLVSGNTYYGMQIQGNNSPTDSGADHNTVQGNLIGTDVAGTTAIANGGYGIFLNSNANLIGGPTAAARNVIAASGNVVGGDGIAIVGYSNSVHGNYIGTDISGTMPLGNSGNPFVLQGNGIRIMGGTGNQIGGAGVGEGNLIAFNAGAGVMVSGSDPTANSIRGNSLHSNVGLGIDLAPWAAGVAGVTLNDLNDVDTGPNDYQNFPLVASAASSVSGTAITGSFNSSANFSFTLDFYANVVADQTGFGEGRIYLGAAVVSTDATGNVNYNVSVPGVAPVGYYVTATATNAAGSTSEFSGNTIAIAACTEVASLVVTTTSDTVANDCETSLREAITYANSRANSLNPGGAPDVISFNIPGAGVHTIQLQSLLPWINDSIVIDGYSQPGSSVNTLIDGDNAVINVEIDGSLAGGSGLVLAASNNTVRGLAINNFAGAGIFVYYSNSNTLAGNFIGTDASGTIARPNDLGIKILAAQDNMVGGISPADRNLLSGNKYDGINVQGTYNPTLWLSTGNQIIGNYAGTDASGTVALPNGSGGFDGVGINIGGGFGNRVINNLVSGNGDGGISLGDYSTVVQGNLIGTDVTGTLPLANTGNLFYPQFGNGIAVYGVGNEIGGTDVGEANLIAFNAGAGIFVADVPSYIYPDSSVVSMRGNSIHSNGGLGIDLAPFSVSGQGVSGNDTGDGDVGPNSYQNFPLLAAVQSSGSGTTITGTLNSTPLTTFTLDFYANDISDPSGYGEGKRYLGSSLVVTDATGNVTYSVTVTGITSVGQTVSATATGPSGTSEFSGLSTVTLDNTAPTQLSINSATINENETFTLVGSFSDVDLLDTHTVTIHWGEGLPEVFVLPVGTRSFSFDHLYQDDNPTLTGIDSYAVNVTVSDSAADSATEATIVTVKNVGPYNLNWSLASHEIDERDSVTVNGTFADPGTNDLHIVTIDWGDGLPIQYALPVGDREFSLSHQYVDDNPTATPSDTYQIKLTMTDDDGATAKEAPRLIYGLKSRNGGTTVGSISPTHLYSFQSDGTSFTDVGPIKVGTTNIDADALAFSPTLGLFAFQIHSTANGNTAPTSSTLIAINPSTAVATPISLFSGRVIRSAVFDSTDRLWVVDQTQNQLLQIDPSNGQILGTPISITINGLPTTIRDLAVREDGTFVATDSTVGANFYTLDIQTGALTELFVDTTLQAPLQGTTRPSALGLVAVDNMFYTYDAQGTDDIYRYDVSSGFERQLVFADIISLANGGYNSGQGDLAIAAVNHVLKVNNLDPVIEHLTATSVDENGVVHLTGTYSDLGSDTHTLTVQWGDGATQVVAVSGGGFHLTHQYLDDNHANSNGEYSISVTITDDDTGIAVGSTNATVNNVNPVLDSLTATPTVVESGTIQLIGTYHDVGSQDTHTLTIQWGDGTSQLVHVADGSFIVTHQYVDDNPTNSSSDAMNIVVTLADDDGGQVAGSVVTTVQNVAPTMGTLSNTAAILGDALMGVTAVGVSASFADIGTMDTHTATINWGDGHTTLGTIAASLGTGTITGSHVYTSGGIFTISITLRDDDGGAVTTTTTAIISGIGLVGDTLYVIGTDNDDEVEIDWNRRGGGCNNDRRESIDVSAEFGSRSRRREYEREFDAEDIGQIVIMLGAGDDQAEIDGSVTQPALIDGGTDDDKLQAGGGRSTLLGGAGNDRLMGGAAADVLDGGDGDDSLNGGRGRDILIGGWGADCLDGGQDDDILIGGRVAVSTATLESLRDAWNANADYTVRRNAISAILIPGTTVLNDGARDRLRGSQGRDLFFAKLSGANKDELEDLFGNEALFQI